MGDQEDGRGVPRPVVGHRPSQAVDFVEQTQVDALALRLAPATALTSLRANRPGNSGVPEIHSLPNTHLVMHGSSSVPEDLLAIINRVRRKIQKPTAYR